MEGANKFVSNMAKKKMGTAVVSTHISSQLDAVASGLPSLNSAVSEDAVFLVIVFFFFFCLAPIFLIVEEQYIPLLLPIWVDVLHGSVRERNLLHPVGEVALHLL